MQGSSRFENADRRRHSRFELLEYAEVFVNDDADADNAMLVDISLGGMQIRSRRRFDVGDKCLMLIGKGGDKPLSVHVEARYSVNVSGSALYASGFRFRPASSAERIELVDYIHNIFLKQGENLV
jgi:c-di-GMP-binding flagellar brake protein YcgR